MRIEKKKPKFVESLFYFFRVKLVFCFVCFSVDVCKFVMEVNDDVA